jgi:DNA-binding NarL/FixJ family response regulator
VREASEADDRLAVARDARDADVLVYDRIIGFDRGSGSRVQKRLLMYDERSPENASTILRLGFDGAIARSASPHELSDALFAVAAGYFVFSRAALSSFTATAETESREVHQELTEREIEVLRLMGSGKSNRAIGEGLGVSEHTAKFHVGSILSKLGVETRTDAVRVGIKLGLIPL